MTPVLSVGLAGGCCPCAVMTTVARRQAEGCGRKKAHVVSRYVRAGLRIRGSGLQRQPWSVYLLIHDRITHHQAADADFVRRQLCTWARLNANAPIASRPMASEPIAHAPTASDKRHAMSRAPPQSPLPQSPPPHSPARADVWRRLALRRPGRDVARSWSRVRLPLSGEATPPGCGAWLRSPHGSAIARSWSRGRRRGSCESLLKRSPGYAGWSRPSRGSAGQRAPAVWLVRR